MFAANALLITLLIVATAFFVATEFAIIRIRPSRVEQLVLEGRKNALAVRKVTTHLDEYLSACQLGITITALALGWLGEPTVESLLRPFFEQLHLPPEMITLLSFLIAFISITYLHVVLGELAPKTLAIQKAEAISLLAAHPIIFFYKVMFPFIWILNGSANRIVRIFGLKVVTDQEEAHSEEELQIIISDSYKSGKINKTEYGYVNRIFAFDELLSREIMVPRTDMVCLYMGNSLEQNLKIIKDEQYTRFPVVIENKDNIVGVVNTKKFFLQYHEHPNLEFSKCIQPLLSVPEVMPVNTLLKKMQSQQAQIAILVDEYGGTSGMITVEDILEEIVGEIRDEFDSDEKREVEKLSDTHYIVDGKVTLTHMNELLNTHIENDGLDTIGGWLYGQNSELKTDGAWSYGDITFIVREKDKHRIRKIEIMKENESI